MLNGLLTFVGLGRRKSRSSWRPWRSSSPIVRRIGRRFGRFNEVGQALGQKNTTFAIWIAYTYLTPLSSVGPGCYILWQNTVNSIEIYQYKKAGKLQKN